MVLSVISSMNSCKATWGGADDSINKPMQSSRWELKACPLISRRDNWPHGNWPIENLAQKRSPMLAALLVPYHMLKLIIEIVNPQSCR